MAAVPLDPHAQAKDYLQITDKRSTGELVIVMWFAPPVFKDPALSVLLDKYIFFGVLRAHKGQGDKLEFSAAESPVLSDGNGTSLKLFDDKTMPEDASQFVGVMTNGIGLFATIGAGGLKDNPHKDEIAATLKNLHIYAFDNGGLHTCEKGQLHVKYADETYTFDMPIPGCPSK
jgi:hypothetical protein